MRHNRDILPDDTMAYDKRRNSTDWWLTRAVDHPPNTFTMVVPFATTSAWRWWIKPPTKGITVEPYAPKDRNKKVKIKIWALFECAWRGMMNCDCKLSSNQMVVVADYVPIHKFISLSLKKVKYNIPFWKANESNTSTQLRFLFACHPCMAMQHSKMFNLGEVNNRKK